MKELSIAGKATRYDEALKEAVIAHKDEDRHLKATLERIFPELKESEDERIREELLNYLYDVHDDDEERARWIAWLEKQGEIIKEWSEMKFNNIQKELQEMVDLKHKTEQGEQKPVEKDESKFKVGDKIKYSSKVYDVLAVKEHYYELSDGNVCEFKNQDKWELVEQKPADKVEPKFHKGDWVAYDGCHCQITEVRENGYCNSMNGFIPKEMEDSMHLICRVE